jgi:hypothetical protein
MTRSPKGFCQGAREVRGRGLVREALDHLMGSPGCGWVIGDVDMDEFRRWCRRIKNPKSKRKVSVGTTKKSTATMSRICASRKVCHVEDGRREGPRMYNGELGDLIAEETEFGLDPAPAPGRVLSGHAADQRAELKTERRATP